MPVGSELEAGAAAGASWLPESLESESPESPESESPESESPESESPESESPESLESESPWWECDPEESESDESPEPESDELESDEPEWWPWPESANAVPTPSTERAAAETLAARAMVSRREIMETTLLGSRFGFIGHDSVTADRRPPDRLRFPWGL
jgi:hypothetical protein